MIILLSGKFDNGTMGETTGKPRNPILYIPHKSPPSGPLPSIFYLAFVVFIKTGREKNEKFYENSFVRAFGVNTDCKSVLKITTE